MTKSLHVRFGLLATIIVGIAVVWGFVLAGSPGTARSERFDVRRLADLQGIYGELLAYVEQDNNPQTVLDRQPPATLEELRDNARYQRPNINDPETGDPYTYRVLSGGTVELCATFNFAREVDWDPMWNHSAGNQCFRIDLTQMDRIAPSGIKPAPVMEQPL